jgi:tRNA(fMet)-specific endonuclease VapC
VLDTSVLIDAARRGRNVHQTLEVLPVDRGDEVVIASVTLMELAHGVVRGRTYAVRQNHQAFVDDLRAALRVVQMNDEIAIRAGTIDGTLRLSGQMIGMADAMIAATALECGFDVATLNDKHFEMIEGLRLIQLQWPANDSSA